MGIAELRAALRDKAEEDAYKEHALRISEHQQWLEAERVVLASRLEDSGLEYVFLEDEPIALIEGYQVRTCYGANAFEWRVRRGNTAWACVNYTKGAERTQKLLRAMELADENYTDMLREAQDTDEEAAWAAPDATPAPDDQRLDAQSCYEALKADYVNSSGNQIDGTLYQMLGNAFLMITALQSRIEVLEEDARPNPYILDNAEIERAIARMNGSAS